MLVITDHPFIEDNTLEAIIRRVEPTPPGQSWDPLTIVDILHDENLKLGLKQKTFMTVLRHALTGMKVCNVFLPRPLRHQMFTQNIYDLDGT